MTEPKTDQERLDWLHRMSAIMRVALVLLLIVAYKHIIAVVSTSSVQGRQRSAETRFLLCSRSPGIVSANKQYDVKLVCKGYQTLVQAYHTEHVKPRLKETPP